MTTEQRKTGRILRKVAKLDKAWRKGGMQEGRTENALAHTIGQAHRCGVGDKARKVQGR